MAILLCISCAITILVFVMRPKLLFGAGDCITPEQGASLIVSRDLLLSDFIPFSLEVTQEKNALTIRELWFGEPLADIDRASSRVLVSIYVVPSKDNAKRMANLLLDSVAVSPTDVTNTEPYNTFSDSAWIGPTRLLQIRANVLCDIVVTTNDAEKGQKQLITIGKELGKRVDTLLSGKPLPVPSGLPVFANELHIGLRDAWNTRNIGTTLWGKDSTSVSVSFKNSIIRQIPAKLIDQSRREYLVPLAHIIGIIDPAARFDIEGGRANGRVLNKEIMISHQNNQVRYDTRIVSILHPAEIRSNTVLVPMSILDTVLDLNVTWKKEGDHEIAVITMKNISESSKVE